MRAELNQLQLNKPELLAGCIGKVLVGHDKDYVYQLPFAPGFSFRVIQGYGDSYSHFATQHFSLDFAMPTGTPICAARNGSVISVVDHFHLGGTAPELKPFWNFITIRHADGSAATYGHLMENGSRVRTGQYVHAGELIAYSGDTGWSGTPHLHFQVVGTNASTVPTRFAVRLGKIQFLKRGRRYWHGRRKSLFEPLAIFQKPLANLLSLTLKFRELTRRGFQRIRASLHA